MKTYSVPLSALVIVIALIEGNTACSTAFNQPLKSREFIQVELIIRDKRHD